MGFKRISVAAALAAVCALSSCSYSTEIEVKPDESLITAPVTEAVTEAVTEPAVTEKEAETVVRTDPGESRIRPSESRDDIYSALSDYELCCTVDKGFYHLDFLEDRIFQDEINKDIKTAMIGMREHRDEYKRQVSRSHSPGLSKTSGIVADVICRNGYLSVLLEYGYYEPFSTSNAGPYSVLLKNKNTVYTDYAVTLNYDLITKNRINSISELFYSDTDWSGALNSGLSSEYNGVVSFFPDGEPELFTIDYILIKTGENEYAVERYNSESLNLAYCSGMISSHYRSMAGTAVNAADRYYDMYTQTSLETCPGCGGQYTHRRFDKSRFYSDGELSQMNEELERLYDHGFPGRESHECWALRSNYGTVRQYNPDTNRHNINMNIWSCSDRSGRLYFYDPDSLEKLSAEEILGWNWRDNAVLEETETPDISAFYCSSFGSLVYIPGQHKVRAVLSGFSDTYQRDITVVADFPEDTVNQKYLNR